MVYAPSFDRDIEEPIAGAIPVQKSTDRLVIVEGNYLLLNVSPWVQLRALLDLCVYLEVDDATRIGWLIDRHIRYGKPRTEAERLRAQLRRGERSPDQGNSRPCGLHRAAVLTSSTGRSGKLTAPGPLPETGSVQRFPSRQTSRAFS